VYIEIVDVMVTAKNLTNIPQLHFYKNGRCY